MEKIHERWKDRVAFLMVYIREAHPSDEWQMDSNVKESVVYRQPQTDADRQGVARDCCTRLRVSMPCVVDTVDNAVDAAYAAWPERLFLIDHAGVVLFASPQGPWGYQPEALEAALSSIDAARR